MVDQVESKKPYLEKRFLLLLLAPFPIWMYLYSINGSSYGYSLEFFLTFALLYPYVEEIVFRGPNTTSLGKKTTWQQCNNLERKYCYQPAIFLSTSD